MLRFRYSLAAAVLAAITSTGVAPQPSAAEEEQPLIDVLQSDAAKAEKAITCKKLAVWGSAKAVPPLAELLPDPELTSWARIALEAIPDPAADQALCEALRRVEGRTLIGVVNSLGVRRTAQAVDELVVLSKADDSGVASAAAIALGRIANEPAMAGLRESLGKSPVAARSAVAEGCILCAERLLADGETELAAQLYDEVRRADVPKPRVLEAIRGLILAREADGVPLLVEQLQSADQDLVAMGLTTARELSGAGVSERLVAALGEVAPGVSSRLILAFADRGDAQTVPAVLKAAQAGPVEVRLAALAALRSLGDATCIPVLLGAVADDHQEIVTAAKQTLTELPGADVNPDFVTRVATAQGKERLILLELIGLRRIDAVPQLLKTVDDADAEVRAASLSALGQVAKLDDVAVLITRVVDPPHAEDRSVALKALQAACVRMPDREACAEKLSAAFAEVPTVSQVAMLETLAAMGGTESLQTMTAAAKSEDSQLQDTATRLLGSWMTEDVAPVLLDLAQLSDYPYKVRSLRGYIRVARQFVIPEQKRAAMCRSAWEAAERDAEREMVLDVAQRYPSVDMLRLAVAATKTPSLRDKGTTVAQSIAQRLRGRENVQQLLEQIQTGP